MTFDEEIIKKTTQLGVLRYPLSKAINILDLSDDSKLFEMGRAGDIKAMQELEKRRRINTLRK